VPPNLSSGRYTLVTGWYYWETGERLALVDPGGNVVGNEFVLGQVTVDPAAAPHPDLCCLLTSECCASQE
jgi:hypothetical protein